MARSKLFAENGISDEALLAESAKRHNAVLTSEIVQHKMTNGTEEAGVAHLWVDAATWEEAETALASEGMSPDESRRWTTSRRSHLREVADRLRNSWIEEDATYYDVKACDSVGPWRYRPVDGLQPIDYAEMRSVLSDPSDRDNVYRAVLERRLVYDGHSRFDARWALNQLPWCYDSRGQSFATEIEKHGRANTVRELAQQILGEQERRRTEEQAERERCEAEAKTPHAVIASILTNNKAYPLKGLPRKLLAVIGASPDGKLPCDEVIPKLWPVRLSAIHPRHVANLRKVASLVSGIIVNTGYMLHVEDDDFYGNKWVTFSLSY